jgi:hypothetical protein
MLVVLVSSFTGLSITLPQAVLASEGDLTVSIGTATAMPGKK